MILLGYVLAFTALGLAALFAKPFGGPQKPLVRCAPQLFTAE